MSEVPHAHVQFWLNPAVHMHQVGGLEREERDLPLFSQWATVSMDRASFIG